MPPMGNKCCPRVGAVFLEFSPNKNQFTSQDPRVCERARTPANNARLKR